jgi:hypothetical protein
MSKGGVEIRKDWSMSKRSDETELREAMSGFPRPTLRHPIGHPWYMLRMRLHARRYPRKSREP